MNSCLEEAAASSPGLSAGILADYPGKHVPNLRRNPNGVVAHWDPFPNVALRQGEEQRWALSLSAVGAEIIPRLTEDEIITSKKCRRGIELNVLPKTTRDIMGITPIARRGPFHESSQESTINQRTRHGGWLPEISAAAGASALNSRRGQYNIFMIRVSRRAAHA